MTLRHLIGRLIGAAVLLFTAMLAVGLTAPSDGLFSVAIKPVFMHIDAAAIAESRARIFGVDVEVRMGSTHLHVGWSAIPLGQTSTKPTASLF